MLSGKAVKLSAGSADVAVSHKQRLSSEIRRLNKLPESRLMLQYNLNIPEAVHLLVWRLSALYERDED